MSTGQPTRGLVSLGDIQSAADRIEGVAWRTPLLPFGAGLWLKPENLQPVGAFKIRGAANAIAALAPAAVVTHSSGNHGRALAFAAARLGIAVTVVMPDTSPQVKIEAIAALGAEVVMVPPADRLTAAELIAAQRGATLIPPFDHPEVIAGQGTIGLEIIEDLPGVETILVPVGGGGLISGIAVAVKALRPQVRVIGVEPELAAETRESFHAGELIGWPTELTYQTVADGVRTMPSALTFAHIREYVDDIVTVTEKQILAAVRVLALTAHLVAEPSGALALAAYLAAARLGDSSASSGGVDLAADSGQAGASDVVPATFGLTVAVISGGNVDPAVLRNCLA